jgi:hypothetical protein
VLPLGLTTVESGTVLILIAVVVAPIAAFAFARSGSAWRALGKGRFAIEQELPPKRPADSPAPLDRAAQAAEVRQMLEAKSFRRQRRGEPPIDVGAEMRRLLSEESDLP